MIHQFDDFVNLNLPTCHCTIHGIIDGTYSEAHPHINSGTYNILLQCHKM